MRRIISIWEESIDLSFDATALEASDGAIESLDVPMESFDDHEHEILEAENLLFKKAIEGLIKVLQDRLTEKPQEEKLNSDTVEITW